MLKSVLECLNTTVIIIADLRNEKMCNETVFVVRQRRNSTGSVNHLTRLWWTSWLKPCTSCLLRPTVSDKTHSELFRFHRFKNHEVHNWSSFLYLKHLFIFRFTASVEKSLFPLFQAWRRMHQWADRPSVRVSINKESAKSDVFHWFLQLSEIFWHH